MDPKVGNRQKRSPQRECAVHRPHESVQQDGFQERYNNEDELKENIIAFLPVTEVIPVYEQLCDSEFSEDEFSPLLDYIDDTWIGRILRGNRRREPTFPLHIWNQNDNVKDSLERTNNSVEGWHNAFRLLVGSSHPTIWKIIEAFKKQQNVTEVKLVHYGRGDKKFQKKVYARVTKSLFHLVANYDSKDPLKFLSGIVHNFNY
ncbi:hypothetical protein JTE90_021697 [Oedothorax gibbosus]|uniref:Uncharacterized protein n=1 Tax=Oedothorax gibbosus TaxID=931172 RepID=A0AAV6TQP0_9ARAC|nr:hypothetical protein JTE90_021697 [Oedothorax gibbosus]